MMIAMPVASYFSEGLDFIELVRYGIRFLTVIEKAH